MPGVARPRPTGRPATARPWPPPRTSRRTRRTTGAGSSRGSGRTSRRPRTPWRRRCRARPRSPSGRSKNVARPSAPGRRGRARAPAGGTCPSASTPVAASASRWLVWILEGPAPKRPSAGLRSSGIEIASVMSNLPWRLVGGLPDDAVGADYCVRAVAPGTTGGHQMSTHGVARRARRRTRRPADRAASRSRIRTRSCWSRPSSRSTSCGTAAATGPRWWPRELAPPTGAFYVGYRDDRAGDDGRLALPRRRRAGSARARPAEVKRMYVAPAARRRGPRPADARPPRGDRADGRRRGDDHGDRHRAARGDGALPGRRLPADRAVRPLPGRAAATAATAAGWAEGGRSTVSRRGTRGPGCWPRSVPTSDWSMSGS